MRALVADEALLLKLRRAGPTQSSPNEFHRNRVVQCIDLNGENQGQRPLHVDPRQLYAVCCRAVRKTQSIQPSKAFAKTSPTRAALTIVAQKLYDMASDRSGDYEAAQRGFNERQMLPRARMEPQPAVQQQQQIQPKKKD
jgi:hypothetical protein